MAEVLSRQQLFSLLS